MNAKNFGKEDLELFGATTFRHLGIETPEMETESEGDSDLELFGEETLRKLGLLAITVYQGGK
jgi:hypothetical protein